MDIINSLKSRIGEAEEAKLSNFLGEDIGSLKNALDLTLTTMLGGLKDISAKEGDASGVMKVISDGGHSGDLTDDLAALFNNTDKIQLLITIGKNINNFFFQNKVDEFIERISRKSAIRKTSASSLLSLSAPLVLGALGKNIKLDKLDVSAFTQRLFDENLGVNYKKTEDIFSSVKSTFSEPIVNEPIVTEEEQIFVEKPLATPKVKQIKKEVKTGNAISWLAWLFLGLLGLAVAYYTLKDKNVLDSEDLVLIESPKDSANDRIEDDIFDTQDTDIDKAEETKVDESNIPIIAPSPEVIPEKTKPVNNPPLVLSPSKPNKSITTIEAPERNNSISHVNSTTDNRPMSAKLSQTNTFFGINGLSYKNNSAEISNKGSLGLLAQYLKNNPTRKVQIAGTNPSNNLAEDRAYGLQGILFELGVNLNQTEILKQTVSDEGPVLVKIK